MALVAVPDGSRVTASKDWPPAIPAMTRPLIERRDMIAG